jgi:hypothetical protein
MSFLGRFVLAGLVVASGVASRVASAQAPPPQRVVVVDVPAGEPSIDAAKLRADVASELGVRAVASDDPAAAEASGVVRVSVDHTGHALVVEYRGQTEPITRSVELPATPEATERAAVLLAGNLARDEAGELAASMRAKPAPAAAPTPPPPSPAAVRAAQQAAEERRELDALGGALGEDVRRSASKSTASDIAYGVGLGAMGASVGWNVYALAAKASPDPAWYLIQAGEISIVSSFLLRGGNFAEIHDLYESERAQGLPPALVRDDVEQAWLRAANNEHSNRKLYGWLELGLSSLLLAGSTIALTYYANQPLSSQPSLGPWVGFTAVAAADFAIGIDMVVTDGPVESALHEYEATAGRSVKPARTMGLAPVVAPANGGGWVGIGGTF